MSRLGELPRLGFLISIAVGGLVVAALLASDVAEFWAIVIGWLAFFVMGWALARRARPG